MKTLVAYYSRTGTTKKVAEMVVSKLNADIEEIIDTKNRKGALGYLSGGRDAFKKTLTSIKPLKHNPEDYDLVVIGTPVWASNMAPAVRTFLNANRIRKSAFFCTMGGQGADKCFAEMLHIIVDTKLIAKLALKTSDVQKGAELKVDEFVNKLKEP